MQIAPRSERRKSRGPRAPLVISLIVHGVLVIIFGVMLAMRADIQEIANTLDVLWVMQPEEPLRVKRRLKVPLQPTRLDREQPVALPDPDRLMEQAKNRLTEVMRQSERIPIEDVSRNTQPTIERLPDVTTVADLHSTDASLEALRSRPGRTDGQGEVTDRTRVRGSGLGSMLYGNSGTDGLLGGGGRPGVHDPLNIIDFLRGEGTEGRIVYVLDVSASMGAAGLHKLDLAKKSLLDHLALLNEENTYNIVVFSSRVTNMWKEPGIASIANAGDARRYLGAYTQDTIMNNQGTDTLGALQAAFRMQPDVVVLLTDGLPTKSGGKVVVNDPDLLADAVKQANTSNAGLFIIGLEIDGSSGPGALLLTHLARATGGEVKFVTRDELRRFSTANPAPTAD